MRFTANSISTGELVPAAPTCRSSPRISARGKQVELQDGSHAHQTNPVSGKAVVDLIVLG